MGTFEIWGKLNLIRPWNLLERESVDAIWDKYSRNIFAVAQMQQEQAGEEN